MSKPIIKITDENMRYIDFQKLGEDMRERLCSQVADQINAAVDQLKQLQPGQRRTIPIKVGSITISRAKE
jgi:hypothetical protein